MNTPKERPIIMGGESVRAILDGSKTQTRRVIKPQPDHFHVFADRIWRPQLGDQEFSRPYVVGERLWVRETFAYLWPDEWPVPTRECNIEYRADTDARYPGNWPDDEARGNDEAPKWQSSLFMPRWASRITLEIVGVRAERLQDITVGDAIAEGVAPEPDQPDQHPCMYSHVEGFKAIWNTINAKRGFGWDSNPWVWVVLFRNIL